MVKYKKVSKRSISLLLSISLLCLLGGCNIKKNHEVNNNFASSNKRSNSIDISQDNDKTQETNIDEIEKNNNEAVTTIVEIPKLEDFSTIDEHIIDYEFDLSYDQNFKIYDLTYSIYGEYDLNGDGEIDSIEALLKSNYEDGAYIKVNQLKVPLYLDSPSGEVYIIDVDKKDKYYEIAIFDDGPSADPRFDFFRFDGKDLLFLTSIDRTALMDGQGRFISWFDLSNYLQPQFYTAWGEFKDNEYIINNHDTSRYIGKTYEVNGSGYFVPLGNIPDNVFEYMNWEEKSMREFDGTKINLLYIYHSQCYYVEMPDGERGLLYFWIGD